MRGHIFMGKKWERYRILVTKMQSISDCGNYSGAGWGLGYKVARVDEALVWWGNLLKLSGRFLLRGDPGVNT